MKKLRIMAALWLALTLVSQSLAAAGVRCNMMNSMPNITDMSNMQGMEHSTHAMPMNNAMHDMGESCCDEDQCSILNCLSTVMFVSPDQSVATAIAGIKSGPIVFSYLIPDLPSLNPPPIFR